jgi:hypothetical protein
MNPNPHFKDFPGEELVMVGKYFYSPFNYKSMVVPQKCCKEYGIIYRRVFRIIMKEIIKYGSNLIWIAKT